MLFSRVRLPRADNIPDIVKHLVRNDRARSAPSRARCRYRRAQRKCSFISAEAAYIDSVLADGAERARVIADETLHHVTNIVGFVQANAAEKHAKVAVPSIAAGWMSMMDRTPRDLFTEGHKRKFLVIVDKISRRGNGLVLRGPPRPADRRRSSGASLCNRTAGNVALAGRRRYVSRRTASEGPCRVPSSRAESQKLGVAKRSRTKKSSARATRPRIS